MPGEDTFQIHVDGEHFSVTEQRMTGAALKALVGKDASYQLFEEVRGRDQDRLVSDAEAVEIRNGLHFYTVPPATFGDDGHA